MTPRSVVALDTTVYYTSIARFVAGDASPKCGYRHAAQVTRGHHDPASESTRHTDLANQVVSAIITSRFGVPALVLMVRPTVGTRSDDPSAQRRVAVYWEIVRQLSEQKVPVGEVSLLSVQKAVLGGAAWGKAGTGALEKWVVDAFPEYAAPTYTDKKGETKADPRYRATTVAVAAAAALVAGFPVPELPVSDDLIHALRPGMNLPDEFALPAPTTTRSGKKRQSRDDYLTERRAFIETATMEELEGIKTRSPVLRRAIKQRLAKEEEKAIFGGEW